MRHTTGIAPQRLCAPKGLQKWLYVGRCLQAADNAMRDLLTTPLQCSRLQGLHRWLADGTLHGQGSFGGTQGKRPVTAP